MKITLFLAAILAALASTLAAVTTIALPAGASLPIVTDTNASGQVSGYYHINGSSIRRAWLWTPGVDLTILVPDNNNDAYLAADGRLACGTKINVGPNTVNTAFTWQKDDPNNGGYITFDSLVPGGQESRAVGMNSSGRIIGYYIDKTTNPTSFKGFTWAKSTGYKNLTPNNYFSTSARNVSPAGAIAGYFLQTSAQPAKPCVWLANTLAFTPLSLPPNSSGYALAISDTGGIVGNFDDSDNMEHACSWTGPSFAVFHDLTPPIDHFGSWAFAVSTTGLLSGQYTQLVGGQELFYYCVWTDGTKAGSFVAISPEEATDIGFLSASGRLAGTTYYDKAAMRTRAITWQAGALTSLLPGGAVSSVANAVGDDGTVAGNYVTNAGVQRAFAWKNGVARDITPAGATTVTASVVNATGQVGGTFTAADGKLWLFTATAADGPVLTLIASKPLPPAPTVKISGKKKVVTTKASVRVKGTAAGAVTKVTLKNGKKTVKVKGTTQWTATVKLRPGVNKITTTATGNGGTSAPAKLTILRK